MQIFLREFTTILGIALTISGNEINSSKSQDISHRKLNQTQVGQPNTSRAKNKNIISKHDLSKA